MLKLGYLTSCAPSGDLGRFPLICLGVFKDHELSQLQMRLDEAWGGLLTRTLRVYSPCLSREDVEIILLPWKDTLQRLILLGLGHASDLTLEHVLRAAGVASRQAVRLGEEHMAMEVLGQDTLVSPQEEAVRAQAEGLYLGSYHYPGFQETSSQQPALQVTLLSEKEHPPSLHRSYAICQGVDLARDLANHPANIMTPRDLAQTAEDLARNSGLNCQVWDGEACARAGMGALTAVGGGSRESVRFIQLEYSGGMYDSPWVALVGKGMTFDSGGLCLKQAQGLQRGKYDMAGAACVLGLMQAIADMGLGINVVGVVAAAENMPDGNAYRPGDVLRAINGKSIEVINTDAEGRLLLGDALSYVGASHKPNWTLDIATLTGAARAVLGNKGSVVMGNSNDLIQELKGIGQEVGERCWDLPLWEEYTHDLKGEAAEVQNATTTDAGALIGGAFLREFVDPDTDWVHMDIAGTATSSQTVAHTSKGATGVGVRLLGRWLTHLDSKLSSAT